MTVHNCLLVFTRKYWRLLKVKDSNVIRGTRNNKRNISVCKKSSMYTFDKRRHNEWKCIFVMGKESNFVLKYNWLQENLGQNLNVKKTVVEDAWKRNL